MAVEYPPLKEDYAKSFKVIFSNQMMSIYTRNLRHMEDFIYDIPSLTRVTVKAIKITLIVKQTNNIYGNNQTSPSNLFLFILKAVVGALCRLDEERGIKFIHDLVIAQLVGKVIFQG